MQKSSIKILVSIIAFSSIMIMAYFVFSNYFKSWATPPYGNRESYNFNLHSDKLINEVAKFKINNPQFEIPKQDFLKDGDWESSTPYYNFYFYYQKEDLIITALIVNNNYADKDKNSCTIDLYNIKYDINGHGWKEINKDLSESENNKIKKLFEQLVIKPLRKQIGNAP